MHSLDFRRSGRVAGLGAWLGVVLAVAGSGVPSVRAEEHAIVPGEMLEGAVDAAAGEARLTFRGKPVAIYAFAAGQFKPYLRALHTLRGEDVLRDAPADHLHHHGLMYAIRVNGVNFWEEQGPAGRQVGVAPPRLDMGIGREGLPEAVLRHELRWLPHGTEVAGAALLTEQRTLVFRVNPGLEEVSVEWRARLRVGTNVARAVLHGAEYNGLGMRLPGEFDHVAVFLNSAGLAYSEAQTFDVRPARWTSVAGRVHGREVMVAMAADPANPGVSTFFSMRNAFAYLAATQSLGREPLEYPRGSALDLRFLVVAYPAHQNVEFLQGRFAPWLEGR